MVADINPSAQVEAHDRFIFAADVPQVLEQLCANADYVVDAIDTISTKLALAQEAERRGIRLVSSMGAANKLHPECFRFADLYDTVNCPLCRIMRKEAPQARHRASARAVLLRAARERDRARGCGAARALGLGHGVVRAAHHGPDDRRRRAVHAGRHRRRGRMTKPDEAGRAQAENAPHLSREENSLRQPDACGRFEARQDAEGATRDKRASRERHTKGHPSPAPVRPALPPGLCEKRPGVGGRTGAARHRCTVGDGDAGRIRQREGAVRRLPERAHGAGNCTPGGWPMVAATKTTWLQFERLVKEARFIGEVGLDFAPAHVASRDAQLAAFERMARACAEYGVNSGSDGSGGKAPDRSTPCARRSAVMDVLERTGCTRSRAPACSTGSRAPPTSSTAPSSRAASSPSTRACWPPSAAAPTCAPSRPTACCSKPTCPPESAARCDAADLEAPLRRHARRPGRAARRRIPKRSGARIALASERVLQSVSPTRHGRPPGRLGGRPTFTGPVARCRTRTSSSCSRTW